MNFFILFGGLGLFLFGMRFLESSLKDIAGKRMRHLLRRSTDNKYKAVLSGIGVTAILQSSSLVGLLTLTFVGAGIFSLSTAFGIILGTNLGTTLTGWIFNFLGFKLSIENIAWVFIGLGGFLLTLLSHKREIKKFANLILAFGVLFIGLNIMKDSISSLAQSFDFSHIHNGHNLIYFLAGLVLTAVIQSSSATMVLTMSALSSGIIQFEGAVAFVIGANLGTTSTVLLGMIGGTAVKKRVAMSHFVFNLVIDLMGMIFISQLIFLVRNIFRINNDLSALVACHSIINIIGIMLFLPFIDPFVKRLESLFVEEVSDEDKFDIVIPESTASVEFILFKLKEILDKILQENSILLKKHNNEQSNKFFKSYDENKKRISRLTKFILNMMTGTSDPQELVLLNGYLEVLRNLMKSLKGLKDIAPDLEKLNDLGGENLEIFRRARNALATAYALVPTDQTEQAMLTRHELIKEHVYKGLQEGTLEEVDASTLINVFSELEWSAQNFSDARVQLKELENALILNGDSIQKANAGNP